MPDLNLKEILALDAFSCFAMCLLYLFAAPLISGLTGLPINLLTYAGWILLASAAIMLIVGRQSPPWRGGVHLIVMGNLLWVVASAAIVMLFWSELTPVGFLVIAIQAAAVLAFIWGEAKGGAKLRAATPA